MVLVQGTFFVHHSDSLTPTFWRHEFSLNKRDAEPTDHPQPNVELFQIAAVASDCIGLDCTVTAQVEVAQNCNPKPSVAALTTAASSDSPLLRAKTPIVLDDDFTN